MEEFEIRNTEEYVIWVDNYCLNLTACARVAMIEGGYVYFSMQTL